MTKIQEILWASAIFFQQSSIFAFTTLHKFNSPWACHATLSWGTRNELKEEVNSCRTILHHKNGRDQCLPGLRVARKTDKRITQSRSCYEVLNNDIDGIVENSVSIFFSAITPRRRRCVFKPQNFWPAIQRSSAIIRKSGLISVTHAHGVVTETIIDWYLPCYPVDERLCQPSTLSKRNRSATPLDAEDTNRKSRLFR